ncbi:hypothetical protein PHMEG_00021604, partial [Phytophthora megakarya]
MEWVYDETKEVPYFSIDELGHCEAASTLSQNLALWRALVRIIEQRGRPLPAAKHILPSLVSLWNRIKGGIDIFSRHLKNVHSHHIALPPMSAIWLRAIGTLIFNAYQSHQLFKAQHYLDDTVCCTSFSAFQHYKQNLPSFGSFCRDAAIALKASLQARPVLLPPHNADSTAGSTTFEVDNAGVAYKKRNHFNLNEDWIRHRLSNELKHDVLNYAAFCAVKYRTPAKTSGIHANDIKPDTSAISAWWHFALFNGGMMENLVSQDSTPRRNYRIRAKSVKRCVLLVKMTTESSNHHGKGIVNRLTSPTNVQEVFGFRFKKDDAHY